MSGIDSTSDGRQRAWRWAAVFVSLVLFAAMPDKVIAVLSALAKVLIGLFVAKVAWDHGPELKGLIQAIVRGELALKMPGGYELYKPDKVQDTERRLDRMTGQASADDSRTTEVDSGGT